MGREERQNRPFIAHRAQVVARAAGALAGMFDGSIVSVCFTWLNEQGPETLIADTRSYTFYGQTSGGRPISSFAGKLPYDMAEGHYNEIIRQLENQRDRLLSQWEELQALKADAHQDPSQEVDEAPPPDFRTRDESEASDGTDEP